MSGSRMPSILMFGPFSISIFMGHAPFGSVFLPARSEFLSAVGAWILNDFVHPVDAIYPISDGSVISDCVLNRCFIANSTDAESVYSVCIELST